VTQESTIHGIVPVATSGSPTLSKLDQALLAAQQTRAATPQLLAQRLQAAEEGIRSASNPPSSLAGLGSLASSAYTQLVTQPAWRATVMGLLPDHLRSIVQANASAGSLIAALNTPRPDLPHWQIQAPATPADLLSYYHEGQQMYGIEWQYLAAINLVETSMGRIRGLSSAGAQGPMQFLPSTWPYYSTGDINSTHDAIVAAARYLKAHGGPQDMAHALYRYNPSHEYVEAVTLYAQQMQSDVRAFYGYYYWQVYVSTTRGPALLPEGFSN
jgi:membrane-bound lytic murein transglycosylase B